MPRSHLGLKPVQQPHPPILLGGTAEPALRRAGRLAQGWICSSGQDLSRIAPSIDVLWPGALGHITGATSHLLAMVDDVLDVAWIEDGRLPVSLGDTAIGAVAREAIELLRPLADRRSMTLDSDLSVEVSAWADARRVRQVLINLIANAVRYGAERGTATIRCEVVEPGTVTVVVQDDGPGIPADLLDRLFVPFDTLGAEGKDGTGPGVGVGLIVAQGLCEAMGGTLTLTSDPGQGTTARVTLPTAQ